MNNPVDEVSQRERRRILAEDRQVRSTYLSHANDVELEMGGRFAKVTETTVVGRSSITYPQQPSTSPANQAAMVPDELPLGLDINAQEPVGEKHEQEPKPKSEFVRHGWRRL